MKNKGHNPKYLYTIMEVGDSLIEEFPDQFHMKNFRCSMCSYGKRHGMAFRANLLSKEPIRLLYKRVS